MALNCKRFFYGKAQTRIDITVWKFTNIFVLLLLKTEIDMIKKFSVSNLDTYQITDPQQETQIKIQFYINSFLSIL